MLLFYSFHCLNELAFVKLFSGDVRYPFSFLNEPNSRRLIIPSSDFNNVIDAVTVQAVLRGYQNIVLFTFFDLFQRQKSRGFILPLGPPTLKY